MIMEAFDPVDDVESRLGPGFVAELIDKTDQALLELWRPSGLTVGPVGD